jgi:aminopeptidase N
MKWSALARRISCALLACATPAAGKHRAFDPGAPFQAERIRSFHTRHYRLDLNFDEAAGAIQGTETLSFEPLIENFSVLELDSTGLNIDAVEGPDGKPRAFETPPDRLLIRLGAILRPGQASTVVIRYHGRPKRGLHFVLADPAYPEKVPEIWSLGEQEDNHYWFPCYDAPNDRATSEVVGTVPEGQILVSNGRLLKVSDNAAARTRTFHWRMDEPYPVYLTSIAVGPFAEVTDHWRGIPVSYSVAPSVSRDSALRCFGRTPEMLEFFSNRTGVPYPYSQYAQVAVDEFSGGMENISATTMTQGALFEESADSLVAHEAAHQWFGDMVTCRSWTHIWLNESFADFFAGLWTEEKKGEDEYRLELLDARQKFLKEDEDEYRRPVVEPCYSDSDDLFDSVAYEKGQWVLEMLRSVLGDEAFFQGLHHYLAKFAWQSVDTRDFESAMEEETGRDLRGFFREWTEGAGYPEYKIRASFDAASKRETLVIDQMQELDGETPLFSMPVTIDLETPQGREVYRVLVDQRHQQFSFASPEAPRLVRFDPGNRILKTVDFPKGRVELLYQLKSDPDVTGRIWAAAQLAKPGSPSANIPALAAAATGDSFHGVRAAAARALGHFSEAEAREALLEVLNDADPLVRAAAARSLKGQIGEDTVFRAVSRMLDEDPSDRALAAAAEVLGSGKGTRAFDVLEARLKKPASREASAAIVLALGDTGDPRALPLALRLSAHGEPEVRRVSALRLLGQIGEGKETAYARLVESLSDRNLRIQRAAVAGLGALNDRRALAELARAGRETPMLRDGVRAAVRTIENPPEVRKDAGEPGE